MEKWERLKTDHSLADIRNESGDLTTREQIRIWGAIQDGLGVMIQNAVTRLKRID